jgi:hypothetical protein
MQGSDFERDMKDTTPHWPAEHRRMHGRFELDIDGRIFISRTWGPWNLECVQAYHEETNRKVQLLSGAPWVVLALVGGEPIHTPQSMAEVVRTICDHRAMGRCATALVFVDIDVDARNLMRLMLSPMYVQAEEPFYFADDEATARAWLQAQLAVAS